MWEFRGGLPQRRRSLYGNFLYLVTPCQANGFLSLGFSRDIERLHESCSALGWLYTNRIKRLLSFCCGNRAAIVGSSADLVETQGRFRFLTFNAELTVLEEFLSLPIPPPPSEFR